MIYCRVMVIILCLAVTGCASVVRNPVPEADHLDVTVLGTRDTRQWGAGRNGKVMPELEAEAERESLSVA